MPVCKEMLLIYSMYREDEVSVHRAYCERATQPYSLGGGWGRYDLSGIKTNRLLHVVRDSNWVFTLSLDADQYVYMIYTCIYNPQHSEIFFWYT